MAEAMARDDEHLAPESGERDESQESAVQVADPAHDKDDEHFAPES